LHRGFGVFPKALGKTDPNPKGPGGLVIPKATKKPAHTRIRALIN